MFEYRSHRLINGRVLPDTYGDPPAGLQRCVRPPIAGDIAFQLGCPVPLVSRWLPTMLRTCVPEAPVDEYRNSPTREDDVWTDPDTRQIEPKIFSESVSERMEGCTKANLRRSVYALDRGHVSRSTRRRRSGTTARRSLLHSACRHGPQSAGRSPGWAPNWGTIDWVVGRPSHAAHLANP